MQNSLLSVVAVGLSLSAVVARGQTRGDAEGDITPVPFNRVVLSPDGFWGEKARVNREGTIPIAFQRCEETGRIANFARAGGLEEGSFEGIFFNDSDVFKAIEGAAYSLTIHRDAEVEKTLDDVIAKIAAAQEDDGYLYTARTLGAVDERTGLERWSNLRDGHELYNVGHLYEAAVAHKRATGKDSLLNVAIKNADLVCQVFGPGEDQRKGVPGHEEIEIGLVKLYDETGDDKYLDQAKFFTDLRGDDEQRDEIHGPYSQDHLPVVEQREAVGHAVRAGYLYAAMADLAALTHDAAYHDATEAIWQDITHKKLALTGGMGARHGGEAFGDDYELPNAEAYNETCAAVANALFNGRMFLATGDGKYADVFERIIYNGFLSGVALDGKTFFYPNPLSSPGGYARSEWFGTSCCPVNVARFIPSLPGYAYATRGTDEIFVNLFLQGSAAIGLSDGDVQLTQTGNCPWAGDITIEVEPAEQGQELSLHVRIPGWARGEALSGDLYTFLGDFNQSWSISVNGETVHPEIVGGYATLRRAWDKGDKVELNLPMPVRRVLADEHIDADRGRVAVQRGPIVYAFESIDNGGGRMTPFVLPDDAEFDAAFQPDLLGGVVTVVGTGKMLETTDDGVRTTSARLTGVPYFAWANRGDGAMEVFLPRTPDVATPAPRPTAASKAKPSASHVSGYDKIVALHDQVEPESSGDHSIPRMTWWPQKGNVQWVQYDFAEPTTVSSTSVYWFDDTGRGECRVPASAKVMVRADGEWIEVSTTLGVTIDTMNRAEFEPVECHGIRIEAQLQENFSGGILEWTVE